jgi:NAD kinase
MDAGHIRASHERQVRALDAVRKLFAQARVISQEKLSRSSAARADLVLAVGGDNHFQHVSHFVGRQWILGVNSDPQSSEGSLTCFTPDTLRRAAPAILAGKVRVEDWTRLQVRIDGRQIEPLALSEVFLGEMSRAQMSRNEIMIGRRSEIQKSSGLLAVTGAGSGGWHAAAGGTQFARTKEGFSFLTTEPYRGRLSKPRFLKGALKAGQMLRVRSRNDSKGVVVIDTQVQHPFPEGSAAVISLGLPLRVVCGSR